MHILYCSLLHWGVEAELHPCAIPVPRRIFKRLLVGFFFSFSSRNQETRSRESSEFRVQGVAGITELYGISLLHSTELFTEVPSLEVYLLVYEAFNKQNHCSFI